MPSSIPPEKPSLDELLAQWQVRRHTPPGFQQQVRHRLQSLSNRSPWLEHLFILLRPPVFASVAALAIVSGCVMAWWQEPDGGISAHDAYVQSVSPFASVHLARR
jgi:hypothetical protein